VGVDTEIKSKAIFDFKFQLLSSSFPPIAFILHVTPELRGAKTAPVNNTQKRGLKKIY